MWLYSGFLDSVFLNSGVFAGLLGLIFGLIFGSFIGAASWRWPRGQSVVQERSHCPKCQHVLTASELVPVFSWLWQKGRCFNCKAPISPRYPIIEAISALPLLCLGTFYGWNMLALLLAALWLALVLALASLFSQKA